MSALLGAAGTMTTVTKSPPLYALVGDLRALLEQIEGAGGVITESQEKAFDALNLSVEAKLEALGCWLKERELYAKSIGSEIERLQAMKKTVEADVAWGKRYAKAQMGVVGLTKIASPRVPMRVQKNPPKVICDTRWTDSRHLEACLRAGMAGCQFIRSLETFSLDKTAVREAWERGETLPDGLSVVQDDSLRIA